MKKTFSHLDSKGNAKMVDVSSKPDQVRIARAYGEVHCSGQTIRLLRKSALPKGDVLTVSKIAGIMAAKNTSSLIPLCHPIALQHISVSFKLGKGYIAIESEAVCRASTGVEMEALTAVSVAALTIYDMCKAVDKAMVISDVHLLEKIKK